jgi:hypothetical protein
MHIGNLMGSAIEGADLKESKLIAEGISKERLDRMTRRENRNTSIIYPENKAKGIWDLFMTLVLVVTCV